MLRVSLFNIALFFAAGCAGFERTGMRFEVDRPPVVWTPCVMQPQSTSYMGQGIATTAVAPPVVLAGPVAAPKAECDTVTLHELCERLLAIEAKLKEPPKGPK